MKPNEVVKMILQPERARRSMARSASGPSATFSRNDGFDLVAEFLVDHLPADIMRLRPAAVGLGADIEEAGLGLVLGQCRPRRGDGEHRGQSDHEFLHFSPLWLVQVEQVVPVAALKSRCPAYLSGTKARPSEAGVFIIVSRLLREIRTRTMMVAR